jgi:hypothetical protein
MSHIRFYPNALRSDPKYGKFIQHEPARAHVDITRRDGEIVVEIEDYIINMLEEVLEAESV